VFIFSDPWDRRKKKGKKHKSSKKGQSTQDKISSLLVRKASHKGKRNANGNHGSGERAPPPPPRDAIERACNMKEELLQRIEELGDKLPPNTLDQLIDELGGPENVAEVGVTCAFSFLNVTFFWGRVPCTLLDSYQCCLHLQREKS
jgi:hypothetical protein